MALTIETLHKEIELIKSRNSKVELDKSWELSLARKLIILTLTYTIISAFFVFIKVENPFLNAITPTLGFILSNLSLKFAKKHGYIKYTTLKINLIESIR